MHQIRQTAGLCLCLTLAVVLPSAGGAADPSPHPRPTVLVDRSHEWLLGYMTFANKILCPGGLDVVMCDASIGTRARLEEADLCFLPQVATSVTYSRSECEQLEAYVRGGGQLLLCVDPERPIAGVAACFGIRFSSQAMLTPYIASPSLVEYGAPETVSIPTSRVSCSILPPPSGSVLLSDQTGLAAAVETPFGEGRVICLIGRNWDVGASDEAARHSVRSATLAIFRYSLGERGKDLPPGAGGCSQVDPENLAELQGVPGWVIGYPSTVSEHVVPLLPLLPRIVELAQCYSGVEAHPTNFRVGMVATDAGGVAGPGWIVVQAIGPLPDKIAVFAHEYTHNIGACGSLFTELWPMMVGDRVRRDLGYPKDTRTEDETADEKMRRVDPTTQAIDICDEAASPGFSEADRAIKTGWMVLQLEKRYGADFMQRYIELVRALGGDRPVGPSETLDLFCIVAGEDLTPWYHSIGVHPHSVPRPTKEEIDAKLARYRAQQAQWREDRLVLEEYQTKPAPFVGDAWRGEWVIGRSLFQEGKCWVDDLGAPPSDQPFFRRNDAGARRGFWIIHPLDGPQTARLVSERALPANGDPTLFAGFAGRNGKRSIVRLLVNGKPVWEREISYDGWRHAAVSLKQFAGQRVRLEFEADPGDEWKDGAWNYKEIYIDYLIVRDRAAGVP